MRRPLLFLILSLLLAISCAILVKPYFFLWDDNATQFFPHFYYNLKSIQDHGSLSFINFYQFAGHNHFAAGQSGVLYPPAYLAAWIACDLLHNPRLILDIYCYLHLAAGAIGLFIWLRRHETPPSISFFLAWLYFTLPYSTLLSKSWCFIAVAHAYIPWLFWALEHHLRRPSRSTFWRYVLIKTLFIFHGYLQFVVYSSLFEILYLILINKHSKPKLFSSSLHYLSINIFSTLLSLPLTLPMFENLQYSAFRSQALPLEISLFNSIHPLHWISSQLGLFFDKAIICSPIRACPSHLYFWGIFCITLFLGFKLFFSHVSFKTPIKALLGLFLLSLSLTTPWHAILSLLPLFNRFRWPFKVYLFPSLFIIVLTAFIISALLKKNKLNRPLLFVALSLALVAQLSLWLLPPPMITLGNVSSYSFSQPELPATSKNFRTVGCFEDKWIPHEPSEIESERYRQLLGFDFPTLWQTPVLGGYDPLIHQKNHEAALKLNYNSVLSPINLPNVIPHLEQWSVKYLIVHGNKLNLPTTNSPLVLIHENPPYFYYQLPSALPVASFDNTPHVPMDISYFPNKIIIHTHQITGTFTLRLAPIEGYQLDSNAINDGVEISQSSQFSIKISKPRNNVTLMFYPPGFILGLIISLFTLTSGVLLSFFLPKKEIALR